MKYRIGTLEEYLIEYPQPLSEDSPSQVRRWQNSKKDNEYLWPSAQGSINESEKFNLVSVWTNSIIKPTTTKYYINKNGEYSAGIVEAGQVMNTGLKNLEIFDIEDEWITRATKLKIKIDLEDI